MYDTEHVLPTDHLRNRAVMGRVLQVHRGVECAEVGDTFEAYGSRFEVTDVTERTIGDLETADARKEEMTSVEKLLGRLKMDYDEEIDEDTTVYRYKYQRNPDM
ncbi:ASCH domain-containing protein [Halapricum sp. CBA1109]|jgi:hypothetical protein|uniref:ASCH domain-containing protein n=1 Tax=Halapricum sp. CBA1109 TaxID=2668068 RepID=UPI0012FA2661|nr:ASCH domain-containing protein [Halapricum sp. CBA1109]MUV90825.1 ASCH domain-containing protein [Halapricum sp. CBA1109]